MMSGPRLPFNVSKQVYTESADSPGLRELIETALEERAERAAIDADRPQIEHNTAILA
jgi:hypothetical protein